MPELTDEQIIAALAENGHEAESEALAEKVEGETEEKPKPPDQDGLGGALRRAARPGRSAA